MNIPEKVKIGYKDYKITELETKLVSEDDKVCYGNIEYDKANINISTIYDEDQQNCTFIHECLHGIDELVESNLTEDQVRLISKGLYDFIKSNPQIFIDNQIKTTTRKLCDGTKKNTINISNAERPEEVTKKVKDYSIKKKVKECSEVTITFDCSNVEIITMRNDYKNKMNSIEQIYYEV